MPLGSNVEYRPVLVVIAMIAGSAIMYHIRTMSAASVTQVPCFMSSATWDPDITYGFPWCYVSVIVENCTMGMVMHNYESEYNRNSIRCLALNDQAGVPWSCWTSPVRALVYES